METLIEQITRHEGLRLKMYLDTEGIETIGVGHNLRDRPISERAAKIILEDDLQDTIDDLYRSFPWVQALDDVRRNVLINMAFNLGVPRLKKFVNTMSAIQVENWQLAADEMLDSKWARQVGVRAEELANQMRGG